MARQSWLDEQTDAPLINDYVQQLSSFINAMADGKIEEAEVKAQEERVADLMKEIEPQLDDKTHARVTKLLCELSAYNLMQTLHVLHTGRPEARFQG